MTFRRAAVVITSALRLSYTNLKIQNLIIQNAHSAQFKTQNSKLKTPSPPTRQHKPTATATEEFAT